MSLNRSNFAFDVNLNEFQTILQKQKQDLLDFYHRYYDNEDDELYMLKQNLKQKVNFDANLLEEAITNPEVLKNYSTLATMNGYVNFDLPYPIEVANSLGLKEMVFYLMSMSHFTPFVQPRLLCDAIRNKNIEFVQFYIDCGVSANLSDVSRYSNNLITNGYYSLPPKGETLCHALFYAIQAESIEITKLLLTSGARIEDFFSHELESLSKLEISDEMKTLLKNNGYNQESKNDTRTFSYSNHSIWDKVLSLVKSPLADTNEISSVQTKKM